MPRLSTSLLCHARRIHALLPLLLRPCRTLDSAQNELRWLREAAAARSLRQVPLGPSAARRRDNPTRRAPRNVAHLTSPSNEQQTLRVLARQRARGVPLQYLLGTEFFGDLELAVERGVLIPRWETANAVVHLAAQLETKGLLDVSNNWSGHKGNGKRLRVLDLCSGSGCMGLLLLHELTKRQRDLRCELLGVDLSGRAVRLAKKNTQKVREEQGTMKGHDIDFVRGDVPALRSVKRRVPGILDVLEERGMDWDIILANPPYVSETEYYSSSTERSVRCFEPRAALVPAAGGRSSGKPEPDGWGSSVRREDVCYPAILDVAARVNAKVVIMEVGRAEQARRVGRMGKEMGDAQRQVEVWRDEPGVSADGQEVDTESESRFIGAGNARMVAVWKTGDSWT